MEYPEQAESIKHGCSDSFWTRLFADSPEGPGNEKSRVTYRLI